jgi:pilus assembly protein Flp/PilA
MGCTTILNHDPDPPTKVFPMTDLMNRVVEFLQEEDGPTAAEYAVMLVLIIVVCLLGVSFFGQVTNKTFSNVGSAIKAAES